MKLKFEYDGKKQTLVRNKKNELLGVIYFDKRWKEWIWEQNEFIKMGEMCLQQVFIKISELNKTDNITPR